MVVGEAATMPYGEDGHVRIVPRDDAAKRKLREAAPDEPWVRVPWALSRDAEDAVMSAVASLRALRDDLDLQVVSW